MASDVSSPTVTGAGPSTSGRNVYFLSMGPLTDIMDFIQRSGPLIRDVHRQKIRRLMIEYPFKILVGDAMADAAAAAGTRKTRAKPRREGIEVPYTQTKQCARVPPHAHASGSANR